MYDGFVWKQESLSTERLSGFSQAESHFIKNICENDLKIVLMWLAWKVYFSKRVHDEIILTNAFAVCCL